MLRMVSIDRTQGGNAFEQVVEQGGQRLAEGRFIVIFPEGTRTRLGSVTKYKTGGARLAVRTGAKVLPLALNSGECWPRNAFVKRPGLIQVSFGPLIDSQGKTAEQLNLEVQYWIEAEVRRLSPEAYAHEQRT
jgi:1-acyl-sn-glycerol-3-phosphate acyltransferase